MQDFKCSKCNKLLGKHQGSLRLEIKCPRCSHLNQYSAPSKAAPSRKENNLRNVVSEIK